jgi:hypothetical protein
MHSLTKQEAQERLNLESEYASDDDPRFNQNVYIEHEDGTKLFFAWAYVLQGLGEEWIGIVTRDHGGRIYDASGVKTLMVGDHFEIFVRISELV